MPRSHLSAQKGLEVDVVPKEGFELLLIDVVGFQRKFPRYAHNLYRAAKGVFQARAIMKKLQPEVVVGTGGYVSGPVVLAAWLLGIPTLIHEQNALPGYTTRILSRIADVVALTYPESVKYFLNAKNTPDRKPDKTSKYWKQRRLKG